MENRKEQRVEADQRCLAIEHVPGRALVSRVSCVLLSEKEIACYLPGLFRKVTVDRLRSHRLLSGAPGNFFMSH